MAGTGHSYEIGNVLAVRELAGQLSATAGFRGLDAVARWFGSRPFLRFATSPPFVVKAAEADADFEEADPAEREFLSAKSKGGGDVRMFSRILFDRTGPDMDHVFDWLASFKLSQPSGYARIGRMAPEAVFEHARRWSPSAKGPTRRDPGVVREILALADGARWVEIMDLAALRHEGSFMSHCVGLGGYDHLVRDGDGRVFSLRDGEGRSHLTLSVVGSGSRLLFDQAKGHANAAPHRALLDDLAALLNHLGVEPGNERRSRLARVTYDPGSGWRSIYKAWSRFVLFGLEGVHNGHEAIFLSPERPGMPLCTVVLGSSASGLFVRSDDEVAAAVADLAAAGSPAVRFAEQSSENRLRVTELRALAMLLDRLQVPAEALAKPSDADGLACGRVRMTGKGWAAYPDTLVRRAT